MAKVTIQIPDEVLGLAENPQQVENEVLQAVLAFWIARGMVAKKAMPGELLSSLSKALQKMRDKQQAPPSERLAEGAAPAQAKSGRAVALNPGLERLRGIRTLHPSSKGFREHLLSIPEADENSDFERVRDLGREPPKWDS
jgi:hypothetical protein